MAIFPNVNDMNVQYPNRYRMKAVDDEGEGEVVDLVPEYGSVVDPGTPLDSLLFDGIKEYVDDTVYIGTVYIGTGTPPETAVLWVDTTGGGRRMKSLVDGQWVDADAGTLGGIPLAGLERATQTSGTQDNFCIRFESGVQICAATVEKTIAIKRAYGSAFRSDIQSWRYPQWFVAGSMPAVHIAATWGDYNQSVLGSLVEWRNTNAEYRLLDFVSRAEGDCNISLIAIGRWK